MTNDEMKAGRFLRWHTARRKIDWIKTRLSEGCTVQLTTYTKTTRYKAKHADMFKANRNGAWVQRGKSWDCIDGVNIQAFS